MQPQNNADLILEFFIMFAGFEYALKQIPRFLKKDKYDNAMADRKQFGAEHNLHFNPDSTPELKEAWDYFSANPPRKQVVIDGHLDWAPPIFCADGNKKLTWLLGAVGTVRNNLFHGGKFSEHVPNVDAARDPDLLRHAIVILNACLLLDNEVEWRFKEIQ
jgi:hypothetical protein